METSINSGKNTSMKLGKSVIWLFRVSNENIACVQKMAAESLLFLLYGNGITVENQLESCSVNVLFQLSYLLDSDKHNS